MVIPFVIRVSQRYTRALPEKKHVNTSLIFPDKCDAPPAPFVENISDAVGTVKRDKFDEFGKKFHGQIDSEHTQLREHPPVVSVSNSLEKTSANILRGTNTIEPDQLPQYTEAQKLLRLALPYFTGGSHILNFNVFVRLRTNETKNIDKEKAYAENYEELLQEAHTKYLAAEDNMKKARKRIEKKQQAISLASRLRDKAKSVIAAKDRLKEAKEHAKVMTKAFKRAKNI